MLRGISNIFKVKELREKVLITIGLLLVYRFGAYLPVPGIPFQDMLEAFRSNAATNGALAVLNLFSGGALSRVSVFALGIMPYITAQIIFQMMQAVIPSLQALAQEGESGQRKITQYTRYLTVVLALINSIGYLFLFKSSSYGLSFNDMGFPSWIEDLIIVGCLETGAIIIMWLGEVMTQRGIGNGMSLIIFVNIMSGLPQALIQSMQGMDHGMIITAITVVVILVIIPIIVYIERGQRRIPIQYAKRVVGKRIMGAQATYLPIKVNTAGVVPIIFASSILYFPAQIAVFFPDVEWMQNFANTIASGWVNWVLSVLLIVFFAYFYTSMVFNPEETADQLRKAGGFIPGVRPGKATAEYIQNVLNRITLPGAVFMAAIAVVPSIIFSFTGNQLVQSFGGTSILIMVGVAMDTISQLESQLKMHNYEGFFK
ncbi:MAG: preprotein translocase subunit SecY [Atopobiaceae bacterium]|nr:preprotein translocase subunit SecY [Atopobiaceae bacterium]